MRILRWVGFRGGCLFGTILIPRLINLLVDLVTKALEKIIIRVAEESKWRQLIHVYLQDPLIFFRMKWRGYLMLDQLLS